MKKKIAALKAWLDKHVPSTVRSDVSHVVLTFGVTFVATAGPLVPSLFKSAQAGSYPSLSVLHAVFAAGAAAGLKASIPLARTLVVAAAVKLASHETAKKEVAQAAIIASVLAQIEGQANNAKAMAAPVAVLSVPVNSIPGPEIK